MERRLSTTDRTSKADSDLYLALSARLPRAFIIPSHRSATLAPRQGGRMVESTVAVRPDGTMKAIDRQHMLSEAAEAVRAAGSGQARAKSSST